MTLLSQKIRRQVELTGPITIAQYMTQCLFDPDHGYYTTREPFGVEGDFTTAPEISQMFGEMLAAWWLSARAVLNLPDLVLTEAGPGRGTLMSDMLRTIGKVSPDGMPEILMIEASARLAQRQKALLQHHGAKITWKDSFLTSPAKPLGLVANELLDAMPVRQFVKEKGLWLERMVRLGRNGAFEPALGASRLDPAILPAGHEMEPDGQIFEYAPARLAVIETIAAHLRRYGGFALFIDYGHANSGFGDTLQAVRHHQPVSVFDNAGEADLTAHVDFHAISTVARACGIFASAIVEQGSFLIETGIMQRAARLKSSAGKSATAAIDAALDRLTSPDQMGRLFKIMAMSSQKADLPPLKF